MLVAHTFPSKKKIPYIIFIHVRINLNSKSSCRISHPTQFFIFNKNHFPTSAMAGFCFSAAGKVPLFCPTRSTTQFNDGEWDGNKEKKCNRTEKVSLVDCRVFWSCRSQQWYHAVTDPLLFSSHFSSSSFFSLSTDISFSLLTFLFCSFLCHIFVPVVPSPSSSLVFVLFFSFRPSPLRFPFFILFPFVSLPTFLLFLSLFTFSHPVYKFWSC